MNKRIKNKKAKQESTTKKAGLLHPHGFLWTYKNTPDKNWSIGGEVAAYFNSPKSVEIMRERQVELNEFIQEIIEEHQDIKSSQ